MNPQFNSALKQSTSIKRDLAALQQQQQSSSSSSPSSLPTPAALGSLSASLTAFSRTLDEYSNLAKQELNPSKAEKAQERIKNFRAELSDFRQQHTQLKTQIEKQQEIDNHSRLIGGGHQDIQTRRGYASTPENPYAQQSSSSSSGGLGGAPNRYASGAGAGGGGSLSMSGTDEYGAREAHALREQNFFDQTNSALDEYIARGQAVLGDLGTQRDMLKNTQRRLYSAANTLGVSGDTIRMVERRAKEDKFIFGAGVVVFFVFCWAVLHFLR